MPLLDHFHAPLDERYPWESFHSGWATRIADQLSERVPAEFVVAEHTHELIWPATFAVGDPLPELPLRLTGDLFVPVDFEATYQEACRRRRLA